MERWTISHSKPAFNRKENDRASSSSHLNVLQRTSTAPLYSASCINSVTQNKKKEIAIWGNELWWLNNCLKLYKRTRESLRTDIFFPFSRFKNTLPKNLTLSWHFCSRISRFKDFKIFETTSRWKLILTRAAYSRQKCVTKSGNWRTRNNVTYEPRVNQTRRVPSTLLRFPFRHTYLSKRTTATLYCMPIQYTRTFIMICEIEIHPINRFNVACQTVSCVIT